MSTPDLAIDSDGLAQAIDQVLVGGDLSRLSAEERVVYYRSVCRSLGLNELTRPFEYLTINGKLTLYARRDATDQLRRRHGISVEIVERGEQGDLYVVRARATAPDGRVDEATGAVSIAGLKGEQLGNAVMRCETKAKRRVTLSIVGLGWVDESELDGVPRARVVPAAVAESADVPDPPASLPAATGLPPNDPLRRAVDAMLRACERAGVAAPAPPAGADRPALRRWLEERRADLRRRAA
jgi:hypothetical protein